MLRRSIKKTTNKKNKKTQQTVIEKWLNLIPVPALKPYSSNRITSHSFKLDSVTVTVILETPRLTDKFLNTGSRAVFSFPWSF